MSQMLSLRLSDDLAERLDRLREVWARERYGSRLSMMFVEEAMREEEFALIEFRNSPVGRQAYMDDFSLAVWKRFRSPVITIWDAERTADYFQRPVEWVRLHSTTITPTKKRLTRP